MKKTLTLTLLLFSITIYSQTEIDEVVSINFPEKTEVYEQKDKQANAIGHYYNNEKDSFIFVRSVPVNKGGEEITIYSNTVEKLRDNYKYSSKLLIEKLKEKTFVVSDSLRISINGFEAYKLIFKDTISNTKMAESIILELNGVQYYGIYSMVSEFSEQRKNDFFNSLTIKNPKKQKQIEPNYSFITGMFKHSLKFVLIIIIIVFIKKLRNKSR
tara:strand:+ start:12245 stop:12886 length:642 start_codon:yes stop_codon:yes gene_type:complete